MRAAAFVSCLFLVFSSCAEMSPSGDEKSKVTEAKSESGEADNSRVDPAESTPRAPGDRILIKTGALYVTVLDAGKAMNQVNSLLKEYGGFEAGRESYAMLPERELLEPSSVSSITLILKVPAARFEKFIDAAKAVGSYTAEETSVEDVTLHYVDLEARLKTNKEVEQRLLSHLQNAKEIQGIVQVEKELTRVREQVESLTAQFKALKDRVAFSTLTLHMSVRPDWIPPSQRTLWEDISETFGDSIDALGSTARVLLVYGLAFIPWLVLLAGLGFGLLWTVKRVFRRRK